MHPTQTEHLLCARPHSKCFQSFITQQVFVVQLLCAGPHGNSYSFSMYILNTHSAPGTVLATGHTAMNGTDTFLSRGSQKQGRQIMGEKKDNI